MNILEQEDLIKGLDDRRLQEEAKRPTGQVPQFLVVSEIQRRTDMRKKYQDPSQQQPQGTVADQITQAGIASVQPPQMMQGQPMPMQGQPMPMQAYGGGMTPFMRKYAGGGVVRMAAAGKVPTRGERNNNLLNIRQANQNWNGEIGDDGEFVQFEDTTSGLGAADKLLNNYNELYGINTVNGIINRFAPPNENDTSNYAGFVSDQTGYGLDVPLDIANPIIRANILSSMAKMESNVDYSADDILTMLESKRANRNNPPPLNPQEQMMQTLESNPNIYALNKRVAPQALSGFPNTIEIPRSEFEQAEERLKSENVLQNDLSSYLGEDFSRRRAKAPVPAEDVSALGTGQRPFQEGKFSGAMEEDSSRSEEPLSTVNDATAEVLRAVQELKGGVNLPKIRTLEEIALDAPQTLDNSGTRLASREAIEDFGYKDSGIPSLSEIPNPFSSAGGRTASNMQGALTTEDEGESFVGNAEEALGVDFDEDTAALIQDTSDYIVDGASELAEWAMNNPAEALSYGLMFTGVGGAASLLVRGGLALYRGTKAAGLLGKVGRGAANIAMKPVTKVIPRRGMGPFPKGVSQTERVFAPTGAAVTAGLGGLALNAALNGDEDAVKDSAENTIKLAEKAKAAKQGRPTTNPPIVDSNGSLINQNEEKIRADKLGNLANKIGNFGLDGDKKQAFSMALMALGAGIAKGDTAGGLKDAGLAMNAINEQNAAREDKALDRQITSLYYKDRLEDSRLRRADSLNIKVEAAYQDWVKANPGAKDAAKQMARQEIMDRLGSNLGNTVSTGASISTQDPMGII
tara:strand:+ start:967 stop:3375 length:2409 start_codon:yes stop_codon:yes gene_type:complete